MGADGPRGAASCEPTESYQRFMAERRAWILGRVGEACARVGRDPSQVTLVAVSKTVDVDAAVAAWRAGYRAFAENRPQELVRKLAAIEGVPEMATARFDMIGNLQKNKINAVLGRAELVHSISSARLAEAVSSRAAARGMVQPVLLEVNVSGEPSKGGFAPSEARQGLEGLLGLEGIEVRGLMTMAPARDPEAARRTFSGLRELRDGLEASCGARMPILSCGMSDDFEIALEEGSTLIRLGRVVFDPGHGPAGHR